MEIHELQDGVLIRLEHGPDPGNLRLGHPSFCRAERIRSELHVLSAFPPISNTKINNHTGGGSRMLVGFPSNDCFFSVPIGLFRGVKLHGLPRPLKSWRLHPLPGSNGNCRRLLCPGCRPLAIGDCMAIRAKNRGFAHCRQSAGQHVGEEILRDEGAFLTMHARRLPPRSYYMLPAIHTPQSRLQVRCLPGIQMLDGFPSCDRLIIDD
jgi:hypothetical protein